MSRRARTGLFRRFRHRRLRRGPGPTGFWPIPQDHLRYLVEVYPETLPGPARTGERARRGRRADDPVTTVRELKAGPGKDIWLIGGATLAGALYEEIDRLVVRLGPLTLGAGIPFAKADFGLRRWRLTHPHVLDTGALFLTYDRAE